MASDATDSDSSSLAEENPSKRPKSQHQQPTVFNLDVSESESESEDAEEEQGSGGTDNDKSKGNHRYPPGPVTFKDVAGYLPSLYTTVAEKAPEVAACFRRFMQDGVHITSTMSGMGTPELALEMCCADPKLAGLAGVTCYAACDVDPTPVQALASRNHQPKHIHDDVRDRLEPKAREAAFRLMDKVLLAAELEDKAAGRKPSLRHERKERLGASLLTSCAQTCPLRSSSEKHRASCANPLAPTTPRQTLMRRCHANGTLKSQGSSAWHGPR